MDPIDGITGFPGASSVQYGAPHAPVRDIGTGATAPVRQTAGGPSRADEAPATGASGQVRPGPIGVDHRFEKFILAVQALRLDYGTGRERTPSTEEMRAAAEEIFKIDGVPEPFPSVALPASGARGSAVLGSAPSTFAEEAAAWYAAHDPAGGEPAALQGGPETRVSPAEAGEPQA